MPRGITTKLRLPTGTHTPAKTPTIGPATLAKFDGVQLLLLARITRTRRQIDFTRQEGGGCSAVRFPSPIVRS